MANPASFWKNNIWTRGFRDPSKFVKLIISINVGMYVLTILFDPGAASLAPHPLIFLSPSDEILKLFGATGIVPIYEDHRYWTLVSASYLHGGILHIFFNMAAFNQLATVVNREFGVYRMFAIYTFGGVVGFWISYMAGNAGGDAGNGSRRISDRISVPEASGTLSGNGHPRIRHNYQYPHG